MNWGFGQPGLDERRKVLSVTGLVHFFDRNEFQSYRIDAVAHAAFIRGTIIEHVAQMGIRHFRTDFRALHAEGGVFLFEDLTPFERPCEARPSTARIKFVE